MANTPSKYEIIDSTAGFLDALNSITIYIHFLWHTGVQTLQKTSRFILFPAGFTFGLIRTMYAIRKSYLAGRKDKRSLLNAIIESIITLISAFGIVVGLAGAFLGVAFLGAFMPIIFVGILGFKTLYHSAIAFFCWAKANATKDPQEIKKYIQECNTNVRIAFSLFLSTLATGLVMWAGIHLAAPIGIAAGIISGVTSIIKFAKDLKALGKKNIYSYRPLVESIQISLPRENVLELDFKKKSKMAIQQASSEYITSSNLLHGSMFRQRKEESKIELTEPFYTVNRKVS